MKNLPFVFIVIFLYTFPGKVSCQETDNTNNNFQAFKEWRINYSFVNLGRFDHWHVPINFDSSRPYMHFGAGVETSVTKVISLRFDIFAHYKVLIHFSDFLNPSTITLGSRFAFNRDKIISPYIDLKAGIGIVNSESSYYDFASKPPIVLGLKTGLNARISNHFLIGFGFDNLGIFYLYKTYNNDDSGMDASRLSNISTDIIYQF